MKQEVLINKLIFNLKENQISITEALNMAYAAGYDKRKKDYNQSQKKRVIQEDICHRKVREHESMRDASVAVGMSKAGMMNAIKHNLFTRKGYYFRYAEKDESSL